MPRLKDVDAAAGGRGSCAATLRGLLEARVVAAKCKLESQSSSAGSLIHEQRPLLGDHLSHTKACSLSPILSHGVVLIPAMLSFRFFEVSEHRLDLC